MTHPLTEKHPLHIPNEVLHQWYKEWEGGAPLDRDSWPAGHSQTYIGAKAAQWGYDQALKTREQPMSELITTTQLLEFLVKADKVSSYVNVTKEDGVYTVSVYADWDDTNHHYKQTVCITEEGLSHWTLGDYHFYTMSSMLDYLVEKEEEREIKRQKRQELLSRLTDEEKELLGVK